MPSFQRLGLIACLSAYTTCVSTTALVVPSNTLRSTSGRRSTVGRTLLWDWTLTRDVEQGDTTVKSTAESLNLSTLITSITNWETWRPEELPSSIPFRPMVRTPGQLDGTDWTDLLSVLESQNEKIVHFYNEPDKQSISASAAVQDWREKMIPLRTEYDAKLVSPACASNDDGSRWLDEFMSSLADDEKPDYVGLHFYSAKEDTSDTAVKAAKDYFGLRHAAHQFPIVIAELASRNEDVNEVIRFSQEIADWLDYQSWVIEYGFFGVSREPADSFVSPAAQLLDSTGQWTALGKWFVGVGA